MRRRFALHAASARMLSLLEIIDLAAEAGFDAIEIDDEHVERHLAMGGTLRDARVALSRAGIEALSLRSHVSIIPTSVDDLLPIERRYEALCARGAAIACSMVIVQPALLVNGNSVDLCRDSTSRMLNALGTLAQECGVCVGLELVGSATSSIRTLNVARSVLADARLSSLKLVIDAFDFYAGSSTWGMLEELDPDALSIVRLTDCAERPFDELSDRDRELAGDGLVPLRDFLRHVERLGYQGLYSIEVRRPEYSRWAPNQFARAALESIAAICAEADEQDGVLDYA